MSGAVVTPGMIRALLKIARAEKMRRGEDLSPDEIVAGARRVMPDSYTRVVRAGLANPNVGGEGMSLTDAGRVVLAQWRAS